jgi:hypothetical protein
MHMHKKAKQTIFGFSSYRPKAILESFVVSPPSVNDMTMKPPSFVLKIQIPYYSSIH